MSYERVEKELVVRINTTIKGKPAKWLLSWKQQGLVRSNSDAIRQAFRCFQERLLDSQLLLTDELKEPTPSTSPNRRRRVS